MPQVYLSLLRLEPRRRDVQHDLGNCYDMHRRVLSAFPDQSATIHAREQFGVLYRVEQGNDNVRVLVQSLHVPDWSRLPAGYVAHAVAVKSVREAYESIRNGMELLFRLRANPVKRISDRNVTQDERWRGKRVELRREEDQLDWLQRKGEAAGFRLVAVRTHPNVADVRLRDVAGTVVGISGARRLTFASVLFDGRLRVADADLFRQALEAGIGSAKAFGFGLLSVAPC